MAAVVRRLKSVFSSLSPIQVSTMADINVTVCGGGNAAHVAAGMFAHAGANVRLFFSFANEAEKFNAGMSENGGVTVEQESEKYTAMPSKVSAVPEEVIPQADLIIIITPAFAHEPILTQLKPHIKAGACVGAIPGPGGFDMLAKHVLGDDIASKKLTIFGGTSLPWACRFEEYGKRVSLLGVKSAVSVTSYPSDEAHTKPLEAMFNKIFLGTQFTVKGHFLVTTLWPTNCVIHPGIMYGLWHDWDGKPVDEAPLFYQNTNEFTGGILAGISNEIMACKKVIQEKTKADVEGLLHIHPYITAAYAHEISDKTNTATAFATNNAFRGLTCPMVDTEDGKKVPNFKMRYYTEDLPYGLAVLRGVAEICGVESPTMDKVLLFGQEKSGLEYLKDGKIQGKDVPKSGCPQRYGITTVEQLVA